MGALTLLATTALVLSVVLIVESHNAHAIPPISPQEEYANSDVVVIGKITAAIPFSQTQMKYNVQVEQYLKNPQPKDNLVVIAEGTNKTQAEHGIAPDTVFDIGDRALLFLKQDGIGYVAWWFSRHTDSLCTPAPAGDDLNISFPSAKFSNVPAYSQLHVGATNSSSYLFEAGHPVVVSFDAWNRHFTNQTFDVAFDIKNETGGSIVFNDTEQVQLEACVGHQTVSTIFVPQKHGTYEADVVFDNMLIGTTFEVPDKSGNPPGGIAISSPLEQAMSGVSPQDVKCRDGLKLVIKEEDGSPACVKLEAAYVLIKRGWAASESAYPGGDAQFALDGNSTIVPAHLPRSSGLQLPFYESSRVIGSNGFAGVYNETFQYRGTQKDYVLRPGSTGVVTFRIDAGASDQQGKDYPVQLPNSLNLTNYAVFYHEITNIGDLSKYPGVTLDGDAYGSFKACSVGPAGVGACIGGPYGGTSPIEAFVTDHPGVDVLFEPPSEVLPLGMNATLRVVTMTVTADSGAPRGTYLVELPSLGLDSFLLTVGDGPYGG